MALAAFRSRCWASRLPPLRCTELSLPFLSSGPLSVSPASPPSSLHNAIPLVGAVRN